MQTVIPLAGEPLRYHVQSRSRPEVLHLVDLSDGNPKCGCEQFHFRKEICSHIRAVQDYAMRQLGHQFKTEFEGEELRYVAQKILASEIEASRKSALGDGRFQPPEDPDDLQDAPF